MSRYNQGTGNQKLEEAQRKVEDVKGIMHKNIGTKHTFSTIRNGWSWDFFALRAIPSSQKLFEIDEHMVYSTLS